MRPALTPASSPRGPPARRRCRGPPRRAIRSSPSAADPYFWARAIQLTWQDRRLHMAAANAAPVRTATPSLTSISVAVAISPAKPPAASSLPDEQAAIADTASAAWKHARAAAASGDNRPVFSFSKAAIIAPAPSRSSSAGRRPPSGQRSPAAITATGRSCVPSPRPASQRPVAVALRRQPATTIDPPAAAAAAIAEPFGDGSTSRVVKGARRNAAGDSDHGEAGVTALRPTASAACSCSAKSAAERARQGYGKTRVPASTATVTDVVNDKTSTITRHALEVASLAAPAEPHSKRTPWVPA